MWGWEDRLKKKIGKNTSKTMHSIGTLVVCHLLPFITTSSPIAPAESKHFFSFLKFISVTIEQGTQNHLDDHVTVKKSFKELKYSWIT